MGTTATHRLHKQDVGEAKEGGAVDYHHADRQLKSPGSEIGPEDQGEEKERTMGGWRGNLLRS
jgi:hypothetical protein